MVVVDVVNWFKLMDENNNNNNNENKSVDTSVPVSNNPAVEVVTNNEVVVGEVTSTPVSLNEEENKSVSEVVNGEVTPVEATETVSQKKNNIILQYLLMAVAVVVIGLGLLFILEKEGRLSTGVFTPVIESLKAKEAVAKVNGVEIVRGDYENSLSQLTAMYQSQGANLTEEDKASLAKEALETLINGELLRQEAIKAGMTAPEEKVTERLKEIETSIGGAEALAERMAEFKVTAESLRRDIENEILIQGLFEAKVTNDIKVTDEEVEKFYNEATGPATDLPPLAEVKEEIVANIKSSKEQEAVSKYLEQVREEAEIERLI